MSSDSPLLLPSTDESAEIQEGRKKGLARDRARAFTALGGLIVIVVAFTSFLMLNRAPEIVAAPEFIAPAVPPESIPGVNPVNKECPVSHPVKGDIAAKDGERRVYIPSTPSYDTVTPERCFAEFPDALMEGFRTVGA